MTLMTMRIASDRHLPGLQLPGQGRACRRPLRRRARGVGDQRPLRPFAGGARRPRQPRQIRRWRLCLLPHADNSLRRRRDHKGDAIAGLDLARRWKIWTVRTRRRRMRRRRELRKRHQALPLVRHWRRLIAPGRCRICRTPAATTTTTRRERRGCRRL
jgi:hypothetical protein